jgi:AbiV family abortive infection protein
MLMVHQLPKFDHTLLSVLAHGAEITFENAESLYREAEILATAGALARALFLHQISLEECSKIEGISGWATSLLSGQNVDQRKILAGLARHSSKNKTNAYMLKGSQAEEDAKRRGDWKTALEEFKSLQVEFHEKSNNAKNASLYVDWNDGEFIAPSERISVEMLTEIIARNETFLGYAYNSLQMLRRLDKAPDEMQGMVVEFVETAEKLREERPDDAMGALNELIRKFLDIERNKKES